MPFTRLQEAARELGEGSYVLVHGMGMQDTLGTCVHMMLPMSMMSKMAPICVKVFMIRKV